MQAKTPEEILKGISASAFKTQRNHLSAIIWNWNEKGLNSEHLKDPEQALDSLKGLETLLDHIADTCHDLYGMDTITCVDDSEVTNVSSTS